MPHGVIPGMMWGSWALGGIMVCINHLIPSGGHFHVSENPLLYGSEVSEGN